MVTHLDWSMNHDVLIHDHDHDHDEWWNSNHEKMMMNCKVKWDAQIKVIWNVQKFYLGWTKRIFVTIDWICTVSCKLLILNPEIKIDYLFKDIVELKLKQ